MSANDIVWQRQPQDVLQRQTHDRPAPMEPKELNDGVDFVRNLASEIQAESGLKVCGAVAALAERDLGWQAVAGSYRGPDDEYARKYAEHGVRHAWNVLPDGTIVDGTANQFSPDEVMPRVIRTDDPRYAWYAIPIGSRLHGKSYVTSWCPEHPAWKAYERGEELRKNPPPPRKVERWAECGDASCTCKCHSPGPEFFEDMTES